MTSITKGNTQNVNYNDVVFQIRNTELFEIETFSTPKHQKFPHDHYEVKTFAIAGAIASGKSTIAEKYFANRILDLWQDESIPNTYIDKNGDEREYDNGNSICGCYQAIDLFATINAVIDDKRFVKYIIIDDTAPLFDCRLSNSKNNIGVTQFYWEIRHELKKHAKRSGGNAGGLIIICLIIQDLKTLDLRIRNALAFVVYKTWDRSVKQLKLDPKIHKLLLKMFDKCVRVGDYFWRSLGVAVDKLKKYTLFLAETDKLPIVKFSEIHGLGLYEIQRNLLVDKLTTKISLEMKKEQIQSILFDLLDDLKNSEKKVRISKADFGEIIIRAKGVLYKKEDESDENEDSSHLIPNSRTDKITKMPIILKLRDEKGLSYEDISDIVSVPETTIKRWYNKHKENMASGISLSGIVLSELKSRVKPTALLTCEKEQLKVWIIKYVNPQLYLGSTGIDSMVNVVFELIHEELMKTGKALMKEYVIEPVNKMLENNQFNKKSDEKCLRK